MQNSAGKAVGSGGYVGKLAGAPGGAGILLKRSAKSFTKDFTILLEGSGFCCASTCICKSKAIASLLLDSFKLTIPRCFILWASTCIASWLLHWLSLLHSSSVK